LIDTVASRPQYLFLVVRLVIIGHLIGKANQDNEAAPRKIPAFHAPLVTESKYGFDRQQSI
jgi:hypothetical protein